ncbi:MAG: hypothetical protein LBT27_01555, partial [Prevotellaceae bacterium]|nr:hypothetical protein [Prevotellaceae bacterium]
MTARNYSKILMLFIALVFLSVTSWGQVKLIGWNLRGQPNPVTATATTYNASLASDANSKLLTRGSNALPDGATNHYFRTAGFANDGVSANNQDYFQIVVAPAPGQKVSLDAVVGNFTGATGFASTVTSMFAYSIDGGTTFISIGSTIGNGSPQVVVGDFSAVPDVHNVSTPIIIRYYASGANATGWWGLFSASTNSVDDGLSVFGNITYTVKLESGAGIPKVGSLTETSPAAGIDLGDGEPIVSINQALAGWSFWGWVEASELPSLPSLVAPTPFYLASAPFPYYPIDTITLYAVYYNSGTTVYTHGSPLPCANTGADVTGVSVANINNINLKLCVGDSISFHFIGIPPFTLSYNAPGGLLPPSPLIVYGTDTVLKLNTAGIYHFELIELNDSRLTCPFDPSDYGITGNLKATITVSPIPAAPTITVQDVCAGKTVVFRTNATGDRYRWRDENSGPPKTVTASDYDTIVAGTTLGTYNYRVRVRENACWSDWSAPAEGEIYAIPVPVLTISARPVCEGDSLVFSTTTSAAEYRWLSIPIMS